MQSASTHGAVVHSGTRLVSLNSLKAPVPLDRLQLAVRLALSVRFGAYQARRNVSRWPSLTAFVKTSFHRAERAGPLLSSCIAR